MALFVKACHWGWAFMFQGIMPRSVTSFFLMPAGPDVELAITSQAPCRPMCTHASSHADSRLTADTLSQPLLNAFLFKS